MSFITKNEYVSNLFAFIDAAYNKLSIWFNAKSNKEKIIVVSLSSIAFLVFIYYVIFNNIYSWKYKNEVALINEMTTSTWIKDNALKSYRISNATKRPNNINDKLMIIKKLAFQHGLSISKLDATDSLIHIWINDAAYQKVLYWLIFMENEYAIGVYDIKIKKLQKYGKVKFYATLD